MSAFRLTAERMAWVNALAAPLQDRLAWRLADVALGLLLASGRRTAASWWRAAAVGERFRSYYYFLDAVGREVRDQAAGLLRIVLDRVDAGQRLVFAREDPPTKRSGPKVQGAGIHHHPTPGPAGAKFLSGASWVMLSRIVRHAGFGVIGLPLLGLVYVRTKDVPTLPAAAPVSFQTKLEIAAGMVPWLRRRLPPQAQPPWLAGDGFDAKREFLKPAQRAGFVVVARLRKDAALSDLPPVPPAGPNRSRGRPPISGKDRLSLAQRAGQKRGRQTRTVRTPTGAVVTQPVKSFRATGRPAGGVVRVVIIREGDGSWRAVLCTDPKASVEAIVPVVLDRWGIEQNFHDLKEVEGIEPVQVRRVWSPGGALNLSRRVPTRIEVWAGNRPAVSLSDRSDRPWDDADRRPSHADRPKAVQRAMLGEEYQQLHVPAPWSEKIQLLLENVSRLVA